MKKLPPFLVLALAAALGLTGPRAEAQAPKFNVGAVNNTGGLVVFIAVDKGFFARQGLDAKVVVRNTGPEISKALDAGEIDVGAANVSNIPVALERGLNVRAIVGYVGSSYSKATDDNMLGILAHPDSGITSIAELKGKRVGTTFGSINDMYLVEILRKHGVPETAVNRINSTPAAMVPLFDTGKVDAMAVWEPYLTRMLDKVKGARLLVRGGDRVCFCAAAHGKPEVIYRDREVTQKYVNAMAAAARFVRDPKNLDEVAAIGARYIPGMDADLIKRTVPFWGYDLRLGRNTFKAFNEAVQVLIAQKKMKQPFDPAKYYDTSFIERAMKEHPEWFDDLPAAR
jgi:ABC-type nitrate/sulfonate/bicarbonate transport system substrate-binding protein